MPTINQNSTASIALNAGQWIDVKGTGVAVPQVGPTKGQPQTITNFGKVGPFDFAQTVSLTATGSRLSYTILDDWPDARAEVDASGNPTGQIVTSSGAVVGGGVVGFAVVPPTRDSLGIEVAVSACVAAGGGTVVYEAAEYSITQDHTLVNNVSHVGVPMRMDFGVSDNVPDFWVPSSTGTRFNIANGVTAFIFNGIDLGSVQSPLMAFALRQVHIYGIAFIGGDRAIKIGAVNAMGCVDGSIDMIHAYGQTAATGYSIDICNSQFFKHGRVRVRSVDEGATGGNYRIANLLPESSLLSGDSHIEEIFSRVTSRTRRGVVFEAGGVSPSILNDIKVIGRIHSSRYASATPATVSMVTTSGNADISVSDAGQFALCTVGMPIRFQASAPSAFDAVETYFVISRNTGAQTIRLSNADYGSAITPTASGTYAMYVAGYPTFIARADAGCAVKNSDFGAMACEVTGNIGAIMFSKTRNCNVNLNNPSTSFTGTGVICRDAEIGIAYSGANNVGMDESSLSGGTCNFVNLAGGAYQYSGGSFTLDSSWNGRKVRYSGTSDITITIPRKMPRGFTLELITTGITGVVTFAPASGLGLWSKSGGFRTSGQYAYAKLNNVSPLGYHLTGDLQV